MIFDTDIIIWIQRGNINASDLVDSADERLPSVVSYVELLQNATHKKQQQVIKDYLKDLEFTLLPLSRRHGSSCLNLCRRIFFRIWDFSKTPLPNLSSGNNKHFKPIKDLKFKAFRP